MAYATGTDLVDCFDVDLIGDLAQDTREPVDASVVTTLPNVLRMLDQASGEIDVALIAGGRYQPAQLALLTGSSQSHLVRITCTIAMALLFKRRPSQAMLELAKPLYEEKEKYLKDLRTGVNLFNIEENKAASVIDLQTVTALEIDTLNLLPTRMSPYFPSSDQRTSRYY
jgi:phage gp36-like protein